MKYSGIKFGKDIDVPFIKLLNEERKPMCEGASVTKAEALSLAQAQNKELIVLSVNKKENFAFCILYDLGKFIYELNKKQKLKKTSKPEIKQFSIKIGIFSNDLNNKINVFKKLLNQGHDIRISLLKKKRTADNSADILSRLKSDLSEHAAKIENTTKNNRHFLYVVPHQKPKSTKADSAS